MKPFLKNLIVPAPVFVGFGIIFWQVSFVRRACAGESFYVNEWAFFLFITSGALWILGFLARGIVEHYHHEPKGGGR